jgi:hypothetical protein
MKVTGDETPLSCWRFDCTIYENINLNIKYKESINPVIKLLVLFVVMMLHRCSRP